MGGCAVRLTEADFVTAVVGAADRMRASQERGLNHALNNQRDWLTRIGDDVLGACAEIAVAKWIGVKWDPNVNTFGHIPDVGGVDVRSTRYPNGHLILRQRDRVHADRWFILATTGTLPDVVIRGYIRPRDGMCEQWRQRPEQRWHIPQRALLHIAPDGTMPPCLVQGHVLTRR